MAGVVRDDGARLRSRVEIDARARAARVSLERCAGLLGEAPASTSARLRALPLALGALWRRVAGPGEPVLTPMRETEPRRDPLA